MALSPVSTRFSNWSPNVQLTLLSTVSIPLSRSRLLQHLMRAVDDIAVVSGTAEQCVGFRSAVEQVVAVAAIQPVHTASAVQLVIAAIAHEPLAGIRAVEAVIQVGAQPVRTLAADHPIRWLPSGAPRPALPSQRPEIQLP